MPWKRRVATCGHMATRMGIRELRDTLTQTIRCVRADESIEVTHDGEPVALLVPIPDDPFSQLVAEGAATAATRPFAQPRLQTLKDDRTATDILDEDRGE